MITVSNQDMQPSPSALLSVRDLVATFKTEAGVVRAVSGISLDVQPGETVGIVGESGSGKSTLLMAIAGLLPGADLSGVIRLRDTDLGQLSREQMRQYLGRDIGVIFQDPMTSLNPLLTIGFQVREAIRSHAPELSQDETRVRAIELLTQVGIPSAAERLKDYPHQYSGGMRQRVMIAMAIAHSPALILADEPTTALDVTIQAQVLDLLKDIQQRTGAALMLVTHDLGVISEVAERVLVCYGGRIVESGPVGSVFSSPSHPYTAGLLRGIPGRERGRALSPITGSPPNPIDMPPGCAFHPRCPHVRNEGLCVSEVPPLLKMRDDQMSACHYAVDLASQLSRPASEADAPIARRPGSPAPTVLRVTGLSKHFPSGRSTLVGRSKPIRAVDGVELDLRRGETLALVGESGSGKSTIGRCVAELVAPTAGEIQLIGAAASGSGRRARKEQRRRVQIVFQDPYASLNPRMRLADIVAEPLRVHGRYSADRVADLLSAVGLGAELGDRYPHECSGGQRQRVGIARALALDPDVIVLDEPVSALDVSVQAQVLNVLNKLQDELGVSFLFISHDLSVVRHLADRVAVMYLGKIVELAPTEEVFENPQHPYTRALLSAVPSVGSNRSEGDREHLAGEMPNPANPPSGCNFRTRCPRATELCATHEPALELTSEQHLVSCHFPLSSDRDKAPPSRTE